jgi:tetratricopeptide (TPR) repeat protein
MIADDPLGAAVALFRDGREREARALLAPALAAGLDTADAHQLMGLILHSLGDLAGCEAELRAVMRLAPTSELAAHTLGRMLLSQGRADEAVALHQGFVQVAPRQPGPEFNLAAALYTTGREDEAEAAARRAIAKGMDRIETWMFLARLQNLQGRLEDAEISYRAAVGHDPTSVEAQRELAQLIWMRTADAGKARAALDAAPPTAALTAVTVKLLQDTGDLAGAYALAAERAARDPSLHVLAGRTALRVNPALADRHLALAPPWVNALSRAKGEIEADLAMGRGAAAARRGEALQADHPQDLYVTALLAAAWRMTGDLRHGQLYDYSRMVRAYRIETPQGWATLEAYLADLERALDRLHAGLTHPVGQSVRHGSQTLRGLMDYPDPEIAAFFKAVEAPIRQHIAHMGEAGQDYGIAGSWSVRLNRQGFHTDHVHPEGWLSSAFYIRVPASTAGEGWLKFGQPGTPCDPPLEAEYFLKPEPGMLVLFPSYMWHGTVPFSADETRLTCAFDVVRA